MAASERLEKADPSSPKQSKAKADPVNVCRVKQGGYLVMDDPRVVLTTTLGSCVAVCARDPQTGWGGMNHFVLPRYDAPLNHLPDVALRYGSYSIERMFNEILSRGGRRERLEIKVFGGANLIAMSSNIGFRNADFVETYLVQEGFGITASHLRGHEARRIRYTPSTGRVQMNVIRRETVSIFADEERLAAKNAEVSSTAEIFRPSK